MYLTATVCVWGSPAAANPVLRALACVGSAGGPPGARKRPAAGHQVPASGDSMLDHPAENRSQYARIPGGQHGLAPELVSADQRARLNAAMVQVAAETGYVAATVEDVLGRAGVSRRTFYDNHKNKQECFISAFDAVLLDWTSQGALAYQTAAPNGTEGTVRARLRAGLLALFELVFSDPLGGRVLFI